MHQHLWVLQLSTVYRRERRPQSPKGWPFDTFFCEPNPADRAPHAASPRAASHKSLPDKPQSPRKLPAKTVHRHPRKAAPPSPSRATTSALVQLGTTLQALGAQLVNLVVDCAA